MKLMVSDEAHVFKLSDGTFWSDAVTDYNFYKRYMDVFDEVRLVARMKEVDVLPPKAVRLDGPNLEIFGIPFFQGPVQFLKVFLKLYRSLKNVDKTCDVAILRMPSITSQVVLRRIRKNIPLGGEIIYDPYLDAHTNDNGILMRIIWMLISHDLSKFCWRANGVSYVTEQAIQLHYPPRAKRGGESEKYFETFYSSIILKENAFFKEKEYHKMDSLTLVMSDVAMNNNRKGEDIFIKTVYESRKKGYNVKGILIGDGTKRKEYEKLAQDLNVDSYITFTGLLPSSVEVREVMKEADLFLFPTKAEGLPRGVLEAMAIGLPVVTTPVGGIPEVIESRYLFNPLDIIGFSKMICHLIENPDEMTEMSKKNYKKALEYSNINLQRKRNEFYLKLINLVQ